MSFLKRNVLDNPKTTIAGVIGAAATILGSLFGITVPLDAQTAITAITVFAVGFFAKDAKND